MSEGVTWWPSSSTLPAPCLPGHPERYACVAVGPRLGLQALTSTALHCRVADPSVPCRPQALPAAHRLLSHRVTGAEAVQQVLQAWCNADLFPGIAHALRSMHSAGLKLAVLTNGSGGWWQCKGQFG